MGKISVSLALLCLALSAVFLICTDQGVEAAAPLPRFRGREEVKGKKKTRSFISSYIAGWLNYISSRLFWTYKLWSYSLTVLSTPAIILINKVLLGANKLFSLVSNFVFKSSYGVSVSSWFLQDEKFAKLLVPWTARQMTRKGKWNWSAGNDQDSTLAI